MSANPAKAAPLARLDALLAQILDDACDPKRRDDAIAVRALCVRQCAGLLAAIAELYETGINGHTEAP